jgi:ubiquinol-cytochrome c reductase cytochrome b subunit
MPAFAKDLEHPERNELSLRELSAIVDWLRGDYYRPTDENPVLPHPEHDARRTLALARASGSLPGEVVGAAPPAEQKPSERAVALFRENCAACHSHADDQGRGIVAKNPTAPNLFGFGSRAWLAGLLSPEKITGPDYFGKTAHVGGDMVTFVEGDLADLDDAKQKTLASVIAALSAEAALPAQKEADAQAMADGSLESGRKAIAADIAGNGQTCLDCHKFRDNGDLGSAPDLTGYASLQWLEAFIANPRDERFYDVRNDRMPSFHLADRGQRNLLTPAEINLLARWLRGEAVD